jgi:hypothetical protein
MKDAPFVRSFREGYHIENTDNEEKENKKMISLEYTLPKVKEQYSHASASK